MRQRVARFVSCRALSPVLTVNRNQLEDVRVEDCIVVTPHTSLMTRRQDNLNLSGSPRIVLMCS